MKTAFIFPGQGSQFVGMGQDLFDSYPLARERYGQARDILGFNISRICFQGPEEQLVQTKITQPAIFVHSYILYELLSHKNIVPDMVAGHSLGEYSALAVSGAIDFQAGLNLVKLRGELMQNAGNSQVGAMAALIGLKQQAVEEICEKASQEGIVAIANINTPEQMVISGSEKGIEAAIQLAKGSGAKRALRLNVSGAFHSSLMKPATTQFNQALEEVRFRNPVIPVYLNVTARPAQSVREIRELLGKQLLSPVRWTQTINNMMDDGSLYFYEVGPGKVLSGLLRRINKSATAISVGDKAQLEKVING